MTRGLRKVVSRVSCGAYELTLSYASLALFAAQIETTRSALFRPVQGSKVVLGGESPSC